MIPGRIIFVSRGITVKFSRYRLGVAQRVGRGIALFFHDRSTRRGWVVSKTLRPYFTPGKDPVPILQKAGWAPGPVWTGVKSRPHRDSIPDRPARSQWLYRLSYTVHVGKYIYYLTNTAIGVWIEDGKIAVYLLRSFSPKQMQNPFRSTKIMYW